jgi:uncharacterized protein YoxC
MSEKSPFPRTADDEAILQQQYRRALSSFEGIILSQIDVKNRLGDRLNYAIQTGIIILGVVALSILVLLLTLSTQVNRISAVVAEMNTHFTSVSAQMNRIRGHMSAMDQRVALLEDMQGRTAVMDQEMRSIAADMDRMSRMVAGIDGHVATVRDRVGAISGNMDLMNTEVQVMTAEMGRMSRPARSMNKMFPFP